MKPIETAITRIFATDGSIVGLGFLITESRIMTCAHVVADAVGIQRDDVNPPAQLIAVDFPLVDDNKKCTARVVVWLPSRDGTDDIAVLELREAAPSRAKPANLVTVDMWGAEFGVYGFPRYNPKGVWAKGKVSGLIEGKRIQIDALEGNTSYFIEPGFSGSPVYSNDSNINGVIGMAVSAESDPNIKVGFMIPSEVLLAKMNQQRHLPQLTDDEQTSSPRTPINMTDSKPQPVPHIWQRKKQPRVVYIGKFEEMQPVYQSKRVFVAHHFFGGNTSEMQDYRVFLKDGLEQIGYLPLFARDDSGTLLETICHDIINAEAGIYDISGYNANVLIELGMSIGLNQPTIVIAQDDKKPLIDPLQQLNPLRYTDRYDLAERIGQAVKEHIQKYHHAGMSPRFCAACGLDCIARKPRQSPEDEYQLIGADPDQDKAIFFHLKKAVRNFNLARQELEGDFNLTVCQWVEEIKRSKIVFFRSKEGDTRHSGSDNASTMVRTGIAIGLGIAWRMILKPGERMPTDLEGYKYTTWHTSTTAFETTLIGTVRQLLSEVRPYGGIYDPLQEVELVEETVEFDNLIDNADQSVAIKILIVNDNDTERRRIARLVREENWLVIEATTNDEARRYLTNNTVTLIITDIERKEEYYGELGYKGLDLIIELQDQTKVIVYSYFGEDKIRELQDGLHPAAFLTRTDDDITVVKTIKTIIATDRTDEDLTTLPENLSIDIKDLPELEINVPEDITEARTVLQRALQSAESNVRWEAAQRLSQIADENCWIAIQDAYLRESGGSLKLFLYDQLKSDRINRDFVLAQHTNRLLASIQPTIGELEYVQQTINTLRQKLQQIYSGVKELEKIISDVSLFGSLSRNTAISPIADIDVLVLFRANPSKQEPKIIHSILEIGLSKVYGDKIVKRATTKRQSWLNSSSILVDLQQGWLEISAGVRNHDQGILVPNRTLNRWVPTNHLLHNQYVYKQDRISNNIYTNLIRLFKWWQYNNTPTRQRYLSGFALECLVAKAFDASNTKGNILEDFILVLQKINNDFNQNRGLKNLPEIGVPNSVKTVGLSREEILKFVNLVKQAVQLAEKAANSENITQELAIWQQVFGDRFPTKL